MGSWWSNVIQLDQLSIFGKIVNDFLPKVRASVVVGVGVGTPKWIHCIKALGICDLKHWKRWKPFKTTIYFFPSRAWCEGVHLSFIKNFTPILPIDVNNMLFKMLFCFPWDNHYWPKHGWLILNQILFCYFTMGWFGWPFENQLLIYLKAGLCRRMEKGLARWKTHEIQELK